MTQTRQEGLLSMDKIREIVRLYKLGYSQGESARSCHVARSTAQDDRRKRLGEGKRRASTPAIPIAFARVHRELSRKGVTLTLVWQDGLDYQEWHLSYGDFCRRYNQWKGQHNPSIRQVYKAGEKPFVYYCGMDRRAYVS